MWFGSWLRNSAPPVERDVEETDRETPIPDPLPHDPLFGDLPREDAELIEWMADQVVKRRLAMPAVLFLESSKPLSFVGSQMMHVASPMFNALFSHSDRFDRVAFLMEDRENLERLILCIERKQETEDEKKTEK